MENEQEIKFYSVAEVSEILGISRSKAYEWAVSSYCPFLLLQSSYLLCLIPFCLHCHKNTVKSNKTILATLPTSLFPV